MKLLKSFKMALGMVCGECGGSKKQFSCSRCSRKFCRPCVQNANNVIRYDLELFRKESRLHGDAIIFNRFTELLEKSQDEKRGAYCPRCGMAARDLMHEKGLFRFFEDLRHMAIHQVARQEAAILNSMGSLQPTCKLLIKK